LPWTGRNLIGGSMVACYGPADRLLGALCSLQRQWDVAAQHFEAAIRMNERQNALPWLAQAQYDYALMFIGRQEKGDSERAATLLLQATALAEKLGMVALRAAAAAATSKLVAARLPSPTPEGVSRREAQILSKLAAGKSNQEIADAIFRSPNTVAAHVRNILVKLGAANRTEAAAMIARRGL